MSECKECSKLENQNNFLRMVIKRQTRANGSKQARIRHMELRLKKIRKSIDYLIEHPWSVDNSNKTRKK